jgi:hypothetical protein
MSDFYIGYLPKSPAALARRTRRTAGALLLLGAAAALILVLAQQPFATAAFEFLEWRAFDGVIEEYPYPTLVVAHPKGESRYLLVAPGKRGVQQVVHGLAGTQVRLRAHLIYRDQHTMVEIDPGSIQPSGKAGGAARSVPHSDLQEVTLTGEIVDTKCYFGVMNPSTGKVHRDCAARCISGGLPPALVTTRGELYLLLDQNGIPASPERLLPFIGEPVTIAGAADTAGGHRYLRIGFLGRGASAR